MKTPSPTPPARATADMPAAGALPDTTDTGAVSLAAALAGILLGASGASPRTSSASAGRPGAARVTGIHR
ncbi:hypothetical protein NQ166_00375 [Microbacterium sp. zg.Y1090]|uniref:hypothetical protein n=1 Tax=Microbacterium TaxID=33882 RepID=UPI00214CE7E3|nr:MULTISPECIES: hypothetical protein [unclassified Microbacterium]MCR2812907.1 hypothetical protein [Microbacterium sp. zg.Y1084]MCR2817284.1 hypothetical protein [Microbacterium sp. zg.Y1090]MDL5486050.1 hypothetical protein [Microbacterium sp. zg-Y1211]WIM29227.1 hypothetical protein QNO26_04835 [Microbacterium sp. zg-Y1090]